MRLFHFILLYFEQFILIGEVIYFILESERWAVWSFDSIIGLKNLYFSYRYNIQS